MQITTRAYQPEDFAACARIEAGAVRANHYFADVVDYYRSTAGELTVACVDGVPVGMGKLTVLFDGSAWLELLRVHPDFQRKGVGRAIYQRYFEEIRALGCPAARMYTGVSNKASAGLAEQFGLKRRAQFHSMRIPTENLSCYPDTKPLPRIGAEQVLAFLPQLNKQTGGFLCINHTFYHLSETTLRGFAAMGWLWGDEDTLLIAGARFQPQKALYLTMAASGENQKEKLSRALHHAAALAALSGAEQLVIHFDPNDSKIHDFCLENGFVDDPVDDIVMEWAEESAHTNR